ncbi:MAG TPA: DUF5131 family protein, partial [Polyangiales bacterium]|nr:DUF5131 family protein [Polyangiales bacterium]
TCGGVGVVGRDGSACVCARYSPRAGFERANNLHWVIVGGESGNGARSCNVAWLRSIVEQCAGAGVAAYVKQLGDHVVENRGRYEEALGGRNHHNVFAARVTEDGTVEREWRPAKRKGGDLAEFPADIRVRQFPEARR